MLFKEVAPDETKQFIESASCRKQITKLNIERLILDGELNIYASREQLSGGAVSSAQFI